MCDAMLRPKSWTSPASRHCSYIGASLNVTRPERRDGGSVRTDQTRSSAIVAAQTIARTGADGKARCRIVQCLRQHPVRKDEAADRIDRLARRKYGRVANAA
jgi:hypothetical protein